MKLPFFVLVLFITMGAGCVEDGLMPEEHFDEFLSEASPSEDAALTDENIGTSSQGLTNTTRRVQCTGSGHYDAVCEAFCPAGFLATGGGCRANDPWWQLKESRPAAGEGWRCVAHEDHGSKRYNRSVTGWVICFQR
jgi:hypothetical protein